MKHLYIILLILPLIGFGQDVGYRSSGGEDYLYKTTDSGLSWTRIDKHFPF